MISLGTSALACDEASRCASSVPIAFVLYYRRPRPWHRETGESVWLVSRLGAPSTTYTTTRNPHGTAQDCGRFPQPLLSKPFSNGSLTLSLGPHPPLSRCSSCICTAKCSSRWASRLYLGCSTRLRGAMGQTRLASRGVIQGHRAGTRDLARLWDSPR